MRTYAKSASLILITFLFLASSLFAQTGTIEGFIFDSQNNDPLPAE